MSKDRFDILRTMALENSEFESERSDKIVANNLLLAVNQIAYMEQCILFECVDRVKEEDFEALLDIILDDRYYNGCFAIDTLSFRKKILGSIIEKINDLPLVIQKSLEIRLCAKAETCSGIALLETYWKYLVVKGKEDLVEIFFDVWMNPDGRIWQEELSERDFISGVLLNIANEIHWEKRIKEALELINARSIGYVGRKDYSLFNPLQWFERISKEKKEIWMEQGKLLMNISEYASKIGDNRAFIQIGNAVSTAAAKMSIDSFFQFAQMVKIVKNEWMEIVFDGIISALESGDFVEDELVLLWEKTVKYFTINEHAGPYDSRNTKNKIYCSDTHEALSLCGLRLGYTELDKRMEQMAPREYSQRRLEKSDHSFIIPVRWYESGYYDNMNLFFESVNGKNCDETFEYIEEQYGQGDFSWDYIKYFIQMAKKTDSCGIAKHKTQIMYMLKQRKLENLDYDGVNRLYNVLFPYLTEDEVSEVLEGIVKVYYQHLNKGWSSADYGLMTDLENFTFALFSRFSIEDNISGLQEILKMHCMWLSGTVTLGIEGVYKIKTKEHINGWLDFWNRLEMNN